MPWPFRGRASEPTVHTRPRPTSWYFVPEPDITAFELALILKAVVPGTDRHSLFQEIELAHGQEIDPRIARHFRPALPGYCLARAA